MSGPDEPRVRPRVGFWAQVLCGVLGHSYPVRLYEAGNETCDCGADHTYPGCVRCGQASDVREWW